MTALPASTKLLLAIAALVGAAGFLLVVEFGLSAGVVHHGVTVAGYDVSGRSLAEVEDTLEARGATLRDEPVCFSRNGILLCADPAELGWRPAPGATARLAYEVGRANFPLGALGQRATAWTQGVNLKWEGTAKAARVTRLLDEWESIVAARGKDLDRDLMRYKIRRAIITYPRKRLRIPVE